MAEAAGLNTTWLTWLEQGREATVRSMSGAWEERASRFVVKFRADLNRRPGDPAMEALFEHLTEQSPLFVKLWHSLDLRHRERGIPFGLTPVRGHAGFRQFALWVADRPDLKLVCLVPLAEP